VYGKEIFRLCWKRLELLANLPHAIVHGSRISPVVAPWPGRVKKLLPGEDPTGIVNEELQEPELEAGKVKILAGTSQFHSIKVNCNVSEHADSLALHVRPPGKGDSRQYSKLSLEDLACDVESYEHSRKRVSVAVLEKCCPGSCSLRHNRAWTI
jgi:hypothetical protein